MAVGTASGDVGWAVAVDDEGKAKFINIVGG